MLVIKERNPVPTSKEDSPCGSMLGIFACLVVRSGTMPTYRPTVERRQKMRVPVSTIRLSQYVQSWQTDRLQRSILGTIHLGTATGQK